MSIEAFLHETIAELVDIDEEDMTPQLLLEDIGLTSLDYVELQVLVRKRYGVEIDPDLLTSGELKNLGDFAGYIRKATQQSDNATLA